MYKDRFRRWGLRKNIKRADVKAMIQQNVKCRQLGKETVFEIRGKLTSVRKMDPYWKRYIQSIENEILRELPSTPPDLTCLTSPPVAIDPPDELYYHHRLLRSVRDYCFGNFKAGTWSINSDGDCDSTQRSTLCLSNSLVDAMRSLSTFASTEDLGRVDRMARQIVSTVGDLVIHSNPSLLRILIHWTGRQENHINVVLSKVFARVALVTQREFETHHPLYLISRCLTRPELYGGELLMKVYQCLVDSFSENTDPTSYAIVNLTSGYNQVRAKQNDLVAVTSQQELVDMCDTTYGNGHRTIFLARTALARCYYLLHRYEEAEQQQLRAIVEFSLEENPTDFNWYCMELQRLALYHACNGKIEEAEKNYREAYMHCSVFFGNSHSSTFNAITRLMDFLRHHDKCDEADALDARVTEILDEWDRAEVAIEDERWEHQGRGEDGNILDGANLLENSPIPGNSTIPEPHCTLPYRF